MKGLPGKRKQEAAELSMLDLKHIHAEMKKAAKEKINKNTSP